MPQRAKFFAIALTLLAPLALIAAATSGCAVQAQQPREAPVVDVFPNEIDRILLADLDARTVRDYKGSCALTPANAEDLIVVYGASQGAYLSSAALNGQHDTTRFSYIDIEPGDRPLYVIVTSDEPTIWQIRGAVERVAKLALITGRAPAAIVGPAPPDFRTLTVGDCFGSFGSPGRWTIIASATIFAQLGRRPDILVGSGGSHPAVALPSGARNRARTGPPPAPAGFDPEVWRWAIQTYPGLIEVDPAGVVGARAEAYDLHIGGLGLAQLVGSGVLQPLPSERRWLSYRIVRPFPRFPSRLGGWGSGRFLRFYLPAGTPHPQSYGLEACVIDETTGAPIGPSVPSCQTLQQIDREQQERERNAQ